MSAIINEKPIITPHFGGVPSSQFTVKAFAKCLSAVAVRFFFEPGNATRFEFYAASVLHEEHMRYLLLSEVSWMHQSYIFYSQPSLTYLAEKFDRIKDNPSDLACVAELIGGLV